MTRSSEVGWLGGVAVVTKEAKILFDPVPGESIEKSAQIFISHAHADHTYGFATAAKKYSTISTAKIYEGLKKKPVESFEEIRTNERVKVGDAEVVPLNAGHMLGSTQFKVILPEKVVLYTGDINCINTLTTLAAEEVECDELIMEATYGNPFYNFPTRERTYAEIVEWATKELKIGRIPSFRVYAAGKAQEIISLFNMYTTLSILAHPKICRVNEVYAAHGLKLCYEDFSDNSLLPREKKACIYVTISPAGLPSQKKTAKAIATGWAMRISSEKFASFPISSHADFRQLIEFARKSKAKKIYTFTGYKNILASYLRSRFGIDAQPIPPLAQRRLIDY